MIYTDGNRGVMLRGILLSLPEELDCLVECLLKLL